MSKTIMTVDDSPSVRQMMSLALRQAGHTVIEACDGRDALAKLSQPAPVHMIITDLNMPNLDGISLIGKVRAMPAYRFVPIIMLTTETQPEKKMAGKAAGATGWMVKPFTSAQIHSVIAKVLR